MSTPMSAPEPKVITGWRLFPLRLLFLASMSKYLFQRKKHPLFFWESLRLLRGKKMLALNKVVKLAHRYYVAIMRVPHWPSKAFDRMVGNGGLNLYASGTPEKIQIDSVILAITRICPYNCEHCYEKEYLSNRESVPIEKWENIIKQIQKMGVSIIVLSGGEPILRFEGLSALLEAGDKDLSDFHLHTSGHGVTLKKAVTLQKAGLQAAGIGLDDFKPGRHDLFRGYQGAYREAVHAIECFRRAGVYTYTNVCLHKSLIREGGLWHFFQLAKALKIGTVNLLEPKPCGGYVCDDAETLFSDEDRKIVTDFYKEVNRNKKYRDYPLVSYMSYFERPHRFGCVMGGLSHFYINSLGDVEPCVYLPVSFGNILEEDFDTIFKKMRQAVPYPLKKECPSVCLAAKMEADRRKGLSFPIPYERIKNEWQKLFI
jgi:MoaA/NifB/PqqE/SkfB family radical SAM enzyme